MTTIEERYRDLLRLYLAFRAGSGPEEFQQFESNVRAFCASAGLPVGPYNVARLASYIESGFTLDEFLDDPDVFAEGKA